MKKIADGIVKKQGRMEEEDEVLRKRLAYALADSEDLQERFNMKDEQLQKLQVDYETLEKDVEQLFKIERQFTDMKAKTQKLYEQLDKKRYKMSQIKPKLYTLEQ